MQPKILLFSVLFFVSFMLQAQHKHQDSGYIIYALGKDTSMFAHYQLNGDDFAATFVERINLNVSKVKGKLSPTGELQYMEGYKYKPVFGKDLQLLQTYKLYQKGDSTYTEQKSGDKITEQKYAGKTIVSFYPYVYMPAILANYVPKKVGDSIVGNHIILAPARKFVVKRISDRKLMASSQVMGTFTLYLNEKGKLDSIDAIGSSYNVKATTVPYLNLDSLILQDAKREQQSGTIVNGNKSDSVQVTIGNTSIKINYSRPLMRGRAIFGEVVPWNRIWRTGANRATKINVSHSLDFHGRVLPAGEYSIFTLPSQSEWTMIFSKEANIWGTNYNPAYDVLRVPMQVEQLKEPVELMTIEVVPTEKGGGINVIWEKFKASAKFTTDH
jgi:hypothetical protein